MDLKKILINDKDLIKLPVFYNFILHNEMIPNEVDKKLFIYSEKKQKYIGRAYASKPISKIIILDNI